MRSGVLAIGTALFLTGGLGPSDAAQKDKADVVVDKAKRSIDKGVKFLREQQQKGGDWEVNFPSALLEGGWSSLALLALLNAGLPADDPVIQRGLKYLRKLEPKTTYVRALQTMVYAEAGLVEDRQRIAGNVKWLTDARVLKNKKFRGWTYESNFNREADGSNTQYATMGLSAARDAGATVNTELWEAIRDHYVQTQVQEGYWKYTSQGLASGSALSMTEAGVCGLLIATAQLNSGREKDNEDGTYKNCGDYPADFQTRRGLSWIGSPENFQIGSQAGGNFYSLHGIERLGRLSGHRFIGRYDWYREGSEWLIKNQKEDGSWKGNGAWDNWPVVSTSFAILFLAKGRTPVLISKLVHAERNKDGSPMDSDWNNDRHDLLHLTTFASRKLFKSTPLAWQSFDISRALFRGDTKEHVEDATSDLLASPIAYFNGHESPEGRFSATELDVLKRYVANGGFILVEACCGSAKFDKGFKALAKELWPKNPLEELAEDHPVWRAAAKLPVNLKRAPKLMGIRHGERTVLIYSPQDLSCRWESNQFHEPLVEEAFNLGGNIIAYATGLKTPPPRGTRVKVK